MLLHFLDFAGKNPELLGCKCVLFFKTREEGPQRLSRGHQGNLLSFGSVCTAKEQINNVNRQPREWKKVVTSYISEKGLTENV